MRTNNLKKVSIKFGRAFLFQEFQFYEYVSLHNLIVHPILQVKNTWLFNVKSRKDLWWIAESIHM